jgi:hypothetical protein
MLQFSSPFGLISPEAAAPLGVITNEVTMSLGGPVIDGTGLTGAHLAQSTGVVGLGGLLAFSLIGAAAAGGMAALMSSAIRSKRPLLYPFLIGSLSALAGNLVLGAIALLAVNRGVSAVASMPTA